MPLLVLSLMAVRGEDHLGRADDRLQHRAAGETPRLADEVGEFQSWGGYDRVGGPNRAVADALPGEGRRFSLLRLDDEVGSHRRFHIGVDDIGRPFAIRLGTILGAFVGPTMIFGDLIGCGLCLATRVHQL